MGVLDFGCIRENSAADGAGGKFKAEVACSLSLLS